jgi:hypothetical protein
VLDGEDQYYKCLSPGACAPEETHSVHPFFFSSSPREDPFAQHWVALSSPGVPQVKAAMVTDHLRGRHCSEVSFFGHNLGPKPCWTTQQIPENAVSYSPSPALQPESQNPCSLHPLRTPLLG